MAVFQPLDPPDDNKGDITALFPDSELLADTQIPYDDDDLPCFPFNVGDRYLIQPGRRAPYDCPAYVLGIVQTTEGRELLVLEPDHGPYVISREEMLPPEAVLPR